MVKNGMVTRIKSGLLSFLLMGVSTISFAQVSASAAVSASIVTPMAIAKMDDMNFGNVSVGILEGVVVLTPAGTRMWSGSVSLPNVSGTVAPAAFNITGAPNVTYSITLPGNELVLASGTETMTVDVFSSDPPNTGLLGPNGTQTLTVGATLNVGASQPEGHYASATPFNVTVNYN